MKRSSCKWIRCYWPLRVKCVANYRGRALRVRGKTYLRRKTHCYPLRSREKYSPCPAVPLSVNGGRDIELLIMK